MPSTLRPLGRFQTFATQPDRASVTAARGALEIAAHPSGALRVRISRKRKLPTYQSWAVVETATLERLRCKPTQSGAVIRAPMQSVRLQFEPLTCSFSRPKSAAFAADLMIGSRDDHIVVRKAYNSTDHVYGLGEKTGWLDKRGRRYLMRNTDVMWAFPAGFAQVTDPLYASFPFFIIHNAKQTYGVFVDNPEFTEFNFTGDDWYEFSAPADTLNYYLLPGPTLPQVVRQYTNLTGRMPLPALWTLGYHQCRWGYTCEADIKRVAAELRGRNIPADGLWLDIDYMDEYRVFTWDEADYPRPREMAADLKSDGFHTITIIDPGVKVDRGYRIYREGRAQDHFLKHSSGKEYNGKVWPGRSAFPDFHRAETRVWWAGLVRDWVAAYGLGGVWNDMNEPAAVDITGPIMDVRHGGGKLPHAAARNTYGLQMARATFEGLLAQNPDSRPFILTRAAFSGAQTVTSLWGGDNGSHWEDLAASLPLLLNLGLSGMPFVGVDIGGFGGDTNAELLARWTEVGAFYPFCRNHSVMGSCSQEPWQFGPAVEAICRRYISLRYQLLPYLYNLFYQAAQTSAPIMRPLVWHYPKDPHTFNLNDQFMLGPELLIAPVLAPGLQARAVYLPKGKWYRFSQDAKYYEGPTHIIAEAPLDELPIFVRAGAILPTWPLAQHTGAIERAAVTLHLWPGNGRFEYYEDDGASRAYERSERSERSEQSEYRLTAFTLRGDEKRIELECKRPKGHYPANRSAWTVAIHGWPASGGSATLDNRAIPIRRAGEMSQVEVPDDGESHRLVIRKA